MESEGGGVRVETYATAEAFVIALEQHLQHTSWTTNLLLAPAYSTAFRAAQQTASSSPDLRQLFAATWSRSASGDKEESPLLLIARVGRFPLFITYADGEGHRSDDVLDAHLTALTVHLAANKDGWLDDLRRVMGPARLSHALAASVARLLGREATPHWNLTAAACNARTLRVDQGEERPEQASGEVRLFRVDQDDMDRLAELYQVFLHPPTPIDECRRHVLRTLHEEAESKAFIFATTDTRECKSIIAGFLYLKRETPFNYAISAVCTAPEFRRRGIAGQLVRSATRWALDSEEGRSGKKEVCIFWMDEAAGRIYRRLGFGDDGMMGEWTSWTFAGLDPGPWPA